jgi:hypothetical protein
MPHPLPPQKTHKHPRHKKIPSYSEKKPGQSYGRLFMKNTMQGTESKSHGSVAKDKAHYNKEEPREGVD